MNKADFPGTPPTLYGLFSLDRLTNILVPLGIDEAFQFVPLCKAYNLASAMLMNSARQISRYTDIERTVWSVGHDVNPATRHSIIVSGRIQQRNKNKTRGWSAGACPWAGHDGWGEWD
jgi:hypothetical protein